MGKKARLDVPPLGPPATHKSEAAPQAHVPVLSSVSGSSRLYVPFRAIGYISGGVPFALQVRRGGKDAKAADVTIVTALPGAGGLDTWALWDATTMRLLFVGPPPPPETGGGGPIVAMAHSTNPDGLLVAFQGGSIVRFSRSHAVKQYNTWLSDADKRNIARHRRAAAAKAARRAESSSDSDSDSDSDSGSNSDSSSSPSTSRAEHKGEGFSVPRNLLYLEEQLDAPTTLGSMIVFGHTLCALSADGRWLFTWNLLQGTESVNRIDLLQDSGDIQRRATSFTHPDTHLNKVLVGFSNGSVEVWNVRSGKRVHAFNADYLYGLANPRSRTQPVDEAGKRVVTLEQSPALDIVAIGFSSGHVLIHDIRLDEPVFHLHLSASNVEGTDGGNEVDVLARDGISFRSDWKQHTVALAGTNGSIAIYSLDGVHAPLAGDMAPNTAMPRPARVLHVIRNAHERAVGGLAFVPGQPLLISSSADNSYKQWFFDDPDAAITDSRLGGNAALDGSTAASAGGAPPRLLKSRGGHFEPPHLVRHYGENGRNLLTASRDLSVRCLSIVRDSRSFELSQGSIQRRARQLGVDPRTLKLPVATNLSFSLTRSRDWADVVTTHSGSPWARTWTVWDKHMTDHVLRTGQDEATTSFVSACGNFTLVGTARGKVECYYMQSARHRREFDTRPIDQVAWDAAQRLPLGPKRTKAEGSARIGFGSRVTGAVMDSKNRTVAICTTDRYVRFYDFYSASLLQTVELEAEPQKVVYSREADLIAISLADLTVVLLDLETLRIVRQFVGFRAKVLDMCISSDSRWLVTTSEDSVIRTFDIPSSTLVDVFRTPSTATSLSLSPTLDFLATTHVGVLGVYLWANRSLFSNVALRAIDEDAFVQDVTLPTLAGAPDTPVVTKSEEETEAAGPVYTSPPQLFDEDEPLVTLSTMPRARWMTLLNLDLIKARDKPIEPPKAPEKAPFFLPQVAGTTSSWDLEAEKRPGLGDELAAEATSRIAPGGFDAESDFVRRLKKALSEGNAEPFFVYLHVLTPPQLDVELRSLVCAEELRWFVQILALRLEAGQDLEAVQAMLAVFLRLHREELIRLGAVGAHGDINHDGDETMGDNEDNEQGQLLRTALQHLMAQVHAQSTRVLDLLDYCTGTLAFLRDIPLV